jgi:excinuclease UvrABC helicase subunit UvrB
MNRASRALLAMRRRQYDIALREIEVGVGLIESLPGQEEMGFAFEKRRSLAFLQDLAREVRQKRPLSLRERLEQRLRRAVKNEDYEVAAELRDRLKNLGVRRAAPRRDQV